MVELGLPIGDDSSISPEARRELIRVYLPGLIDEGFSANASLTLFSDVGLGIGRSDFLSIYREVLGLEDQQNRIRFVNQDAVPSEGILSSYNYALDSEYRFIYRYEYVNASTGETETSYLGINRNTLDTVGEMEAEAANAIRENYGDRVGTLLNVDIWKGFIAG